MKTPAFVLAASFACAAAALAQTAPAGGTAPLPGLEFRLVNSGQTTPAAKVGQDLQAGAPLAVLFVAGDSLCRSTFGFDAGPKVIPEASARTVVRLTAELLDQADGRYSVRLASQRLRTEGRPTRERPVEQVVWLRDGESFTLDMLRDPSPAAGCATTSVRFEAAVMARPPLSLARAGFVADVWFVHRDEAGHESNHHLTVNVYPSADTPLQFKDVTLPLPKLDPGQDQHAAFVRLSGSIRARPRADGTIDLELATERSIGFVLPFLPAGTSNAVPVAQGWGTRKTVAVQVGETTAFEMPQPTSTFTMTIPLRLEGKPDASGKSGVEVRGTGGAASMASKPPAFVANGVYVLNPGVFFKNHVTRLLVRLRPATLSDVP